VYTVQFDFYAIDSWDGDGANNGPDRFEVLANGVPIFSETVANTHTYQSLGLEPSGGRRHLGFSSTYMDSIYRDITLDFEVSPTAPKVIVSFRGVGLQSLTDESWGIDNVSVSYEYRPIPAPGGLAAIGVGLGLAGRRRRR